VDLFSVFPINGKMEKSGNLFVVVVKSHGTGDLLTRKATFNFRLIFSIVPDVRSETGQFAVVIFGSTFLRFSWRTPDQKQTKKGRKMMR
jgi:hypothetical protein